MTKQLFSLILLCSFLSFTKAQTSISGTVNDYQAVSTFRPATQSVSVASSADFNLGDLVLIIQIQGAEIDETLTNNFGTINNYNEAGKYELQRICRISGNDIFFQNQFQNNYQASGKIQVVRVPEYPNGATLSGILTGSAWDGEKGGVLALKCTGTLNLGSMFIEMSGKGFRGGEALASGGGCIFLSPTTQFTDRTSTNDRALKGEGIANYIAGKECSRGPQANGGGGGNNHNGGGSGGSNYGIGGAGGQRVKSTTFTCGSVIGLNSKSLATEINAGRIFMGGGGGAGHGNNPGFNGEKGENGGGIIFIIADEITGSNRSGIYSNGATGKAKTENEGGGGGGAGGTIILDVTTISSGINIAANGGTGAFVDNIGSGNCSGPGGGGGGGVVAFSGSNIPTAPNINTEKGLAGEIASSAQPGCNIGDKNGGSDGTDGTTLVNFKVEDNAALKTFSSSITSCNEYRSPSGKYTWTTPGNYSDTLLNAAGCDSVIDFSLTVVSIDTSIQKEGDVLRSNASGVTYEWLDCNSNKLIIGANNQEYVPTYTSNFAVIFSKNGCKDTSKCIEALGVGIANFNTNAGVVLSPNPSNGIFSLSTNTNKLITASIYSLEGKLLKTFDVSNRPMYQFEFHKKGVFILKVETDKNEHNLRLVIQ